MFITINNINSSSILEELAKSSFIGPVAMEVLDLGYGQRVYLVNREGWGALPPDMTPLKPPISRVRFTYTGMATCGSAEECASKAKELETFYRNKGYPDLPYKFSIIDLNFLELPVSGLRSFLEIYMSDLSSFLVGGDGRVYEGGGWNYDTEKTPKHMWLKGKTISIAYMGNFGRDSPPAYELLTVAMDMVKYGLKLKYIRTIFKLVPYWSPMMNRRRKENV